MADSSNISEQPDHPTGSLTVVRPSGSHQQGLFETFLGACLIEHLADRQRAEVFPAQLARQVIGQRLLQPVMLQDGGMDEARQGGFASGHGFGLLAQGGPDRIDGRYFFARVLHDVSLRAVLLPRNFVQFQNAQNPAFLRGNC